jgi:torulene dioxygenase
MTDPQTGDVFNYNLELGRYATYRVFRVNAASGTTVILATVTGPNTFPAYIHSYFLSDDFVILCIWTSYIAAGGLRVLWEKNLLDAICPFDPTQKVRWLVVDRRHGRGFIAEFESPARFVSMQSMHGNNPTHQKAKTSSATS